MKNTWLVFIVLVLISCNSSSKEKQNKSTDNDSIPACLREEIDNIEKKKIEYPPIQIDEYLYNGKRVFLYTADCCDQFNTLYDEQCKSICSPSGGMEGGGDHKCEDFSSTAKHVKLIWKVKEK